MSGITEENYLVAKGYFLSNFKKNIDNVMDDISECSINGGGSSEEPEELTQKKITLILYFISFTLLMLTLFDEKSTFEQGFETLRQGKCLHSVEAIYHRREPGYVEGMDNPVCFPIQAIDNVVATLIGEEDLKREVVAWCVGGMASIMSINSLSKKIGSKLASIGTLQSRIDSEDELMEEMTERQRFLDEGASNAEDRRAAQTLLTMFSADGGSKKRSNRKRSNRKRR